ncbi:hypothetical protein MYOV003v1_p0005 [Vibrio phage 207E48.1]|nr:hypothetical protein MYOV003v1_p0005 [Vibrio phage 207E48.1]
MNINLQTGSKVNLVPRSLDGIRDALAKNIHHWLPVRDSNGVVGYARNIENNMLGVCFMGVTGTFHQHSIDSFVKMLVQNDEQLVATPTVITGELTNAETQEVCLGEIAKGGSFTYMGDQWVTATSCDPDDGSRMCIHHETLQPKMLGLALLVEPLLYRDFNMTISGDD